MIPDALRPRLVAAAKILLPVVALALLSTLFLVARTVDPEDAIPFADVDLSERARDEQLTAPRVTGVTGGGTSFDLAADTARPDPNDPRRLQIELLRLFLDDRAGGGASVSARAGEIDTARRALTLDGDVRIDTTTGFRVTTDRLVGDLEGMRLTAPGRVEGTGPAGDIRAGAMTLEDHEGGQRLLFTDGVEMVYRPPMR